MTGPALPSNLGDPIDLGTGPRLGGGISFGPSSPSGGVAVPPRAAELDELADVDAPPTELGVLERQGDGKVRATPRDELTSEWFQGYGAPPPVIPGAKRGDMYVDLDSGAFYQLG